MTTKLQKNFRSHAMSGRLNWNKVGFIIWDLNGTLVPDIDSSSAITNKALATVFFEALKQRDFPVSWNFLLGLAAMSERQTGEPETALFNTFGSLINCDTSFDPKFHRRFHDVMVELAAQNNLPKFCPDRQNALEPLKVFKRQYVLTNSSRSWARHNLERVALPGFDAESHLYDFERVGHRHKSESADPVLQICAEHDLNPEFGLMVDNSSANLRPAYDAGLQTVLIGGDSSARTPLPKWVFSQFEDVPHLARHFQTFMAMQPEHQLTKEEINARVPSVRNERRHFECGVSKTV